MVEGCLPEELLDPGTPNNALYMLLWFEDVVDDDGFGLLLGFDDDHAGLHLWLCLWFNLGFSSNTLKTDL